MDFSTGDTREAPAMNATIDRIAARGIPDPGLPRSTAVRWGLSDPPPLWMFEAPTPGRGRVLDLARRAASSTCPILIIGPTGVGKEVLATDIHNHSVQRKGPFISVNCAAITPSLFESQLFGHTRGAFTGATADRPGLVELAHGGTLFLDEVGELPAEAQAKLLRFLAQGTYWPVGAASERMSSVRIISATHRRIDETGADAVREDFLFRLSVVVLRIPSLTPDDIRAIARTVAGFAMERHAAHLGRADVELLATLCASRAWRGGARELSNAIERLLVLRDPAIPLLDACEDLLGIEPRASSGDEGLSGGARTAAAVSAGPPSARSSVVKHLDNLLFLGIARECRHVRELAKRTDRTIQSVYDRLRKLGLRPQDLGPTPELSEALRRLQECVEPDVPWIQSLLSSSA